jgi:alanine racemase
MRPATAVIDLAAVRHNLGQAKRRAAGAHVVTVVKANGYGHDAVRLLPALAGADMLGVACIEEALALRKAGAVQPILLLEDVFEASELPLCAPTRLRDHGARAGPGAGAGAGLARAAAHRLAHMSSSAASLAVSASNFRGWSEGSTDDVVASMSEAAG